MHAHSRKRKTPGSQPRAGNIIAEPLVSVLCNPACISSHVNAAVYVQSCRCAIMICGVPNAAEACDALVAQQHCAAHVGLLCCTSTVVYSKHSQASLKWCREAM